jgi:hypothetical protein
MLSGNIHGRAGLTGIGLLFFAALILASLFWILRTGEHPLAMQRNVPLCQLLGTDVWSPLAGPESEAVARIPEGSSDSLSICALEAGPETARAAASAARTLATVTLTTEADLRYRNPGQSMGRYVNTFVAEMKASGWDAVEVQGPWRRTYAYVSSSGETVLLIEDEGVFIWISSLQFPADVLLEFAQAVTARLRAATLPVPAKAAS